MRKWAILLSLSITYLLEAPLGFSMSGSSEPSKMEKKEGKMILLAKNKKRKRRSKARQKHLRGAAKSKKGKTNIDFDAVDIDGRRKLPTGVAITKNRERHDYDLIKLRLRWHPEMIQSTTSLESD